MEIEKGVVKKILIEDIKQGVLYLPKEARKMNIDKVFLKNVPIIGIICDGSTNIFGSQEQIIKILFIISKEEFTQETKNLGLCSHYIILCDELNSKNKLDILDMIKKKYLLKNDEIAELGGISFSTFTKLKNEFLVFKDIDFFNIIDKIKELKIPTYFDIKNNVLLGFKNDLFCRYNKDIFLYFINIIASDVFSYKSIEKITINHCKIILTRAFWYNKKLEEVNIFDCDYIQKGAFTNCAKLTKATISKNTIIEDGAFDDTCKIIRKV